MLRCLTLVTSEITFQLLAYLVFFACSVFPVLFRFPHLFAAWPGPRCVRPSSSLFVASGPFPSLHTVSRVCCGLFAFFALFWSFTLSIVPRTSVSPPRGPDFPDLGRSNLQRSFAAHFDSSRAFLSPFDAVDDTSSLYGTSQSARFLPTCICFAGILGFHGSRAPPQLYM